jgi:hypothetical protein
MKTSYQLSIFLFLAITCLNIQNFAQDKFIPKYLREDDKEIRNIAQKISPDG